MRRMKKKEDALSDVLGTILLLGVAISIFSVLSFVVLTYPFEPAPPSVNIIGMVDGDYIILEHRGGEPLPLDTPIIIRIADESFNDVVAGDNLTDLEKENGYWNLGELFIFNAAAVFPGQDITNEIIYVTVVDKASNSVVMMGMLQEETTVIAAPNDLPDAPINPVPGDTAVGIGLNPTLSVDISDPDGDPMDVTFYDASDDSVIDTDTGASSGGTASVTWSGLSAGTTYSWYAVADDSITGTTQSATWSFTTTVPPNTPSSPSPGDTATDVDVNADLSWTGGDPDPGDTVTYDVYFGTTSPPPQVVWGQSGTTYDPGTLSPSTPHYWQIIAWDNHGLSTTGPIWYFTTGDIECEYHEIFYLWSATSSDTWQVKDLSSYVPANAVCEIAIQNSDGSNGRYGGVRAVGSSLERRPYLNNAEKGGREVVVMHVQADSESKIQHYADDISGISFRLVGYWTCGTYVEKMNSFMAGESGWQDIDLSVYGVGANQVVEIVMANGDIDDPREAGVREKGSSLPRMVDIHEAEASGVTMVTMLINTDASSTIQVYAEGGNSFIDFYLIGYWSSAPGTYTEKFNTIGLPSSDSTWQDNDLSGYGVPGDAVAEIVLANGDSNDENEMGVREKGSGFSRYLDLRQAKGGGMSLGRMHVNADASSVIQFYHEDPSETHDFYLTGYWEIT